jgi:hypothetical protein
MKKFLTYLLILPLGLMACKKPATSQEPAPVSKTAQNPTTSKDSTKTTAPDTAKTTTKDTTKTTTKDTVKTAPVDTSKKYVLYQKIDTSYNYYSSTGYYLDVTHQTLTGDTLYLKSGTPDQVIQPNPIAGYNPATALADTLIIYTSSHGVEKSPTNVAGFDYDLPSGNISQGVTVPGMSRKIYALGKNVLIIVERYLDQDGGLVFANASYFKLE